MNAKQRRLLHRELLDRLPGFGRTRSLLYAKPVGRVLRAIYLESSADPPNFYVVVFFLPLYVPEEYLVFNFEIRLRDDGCEGWSVEAPDLVDRLERALLKDGLPLLEGMDDPLRLAKRARSRPPVGIEPFATEAVAYSLALGGDTKGAIRELDRLLDMLALDMMDPEIDYLQPVADRAKELRRLLEHDLDAARELLAQWETHTRECLGLTDVE